MCVHIYIHTQTVVRLVHIHKRIYQRPQLRCAEDLATDMIRLGSSKTSRTVSLHMLKCMAIALNKLPDNSEAKSGLLKDALEWSIRTLTTKGHPALHRVAARYATAQGRGADALRHLLFASAPDALAKAINEASESGFENEFDLFVTNALLRLLCVGASAKEARRFLSACTSLLIKRGVNVADSVMIRFCDRLLRVLSLEDGVVLFGIVLRVYGPALAARDSSLLALASKAGSMKFCAE